VQPWSTFSDERHTTLSRLPVMLICPPGVPEALVLNGHVLQVWIYRVTPRNITASSLAWYSWRLRPVRGTSGRLGCGPLPGPGWGR